MRGILEQNGGQLDGGWVCKDRPVIALLGQHWQPAGLIQVRVGEHGVIDRFRIDRQRLVISVLQLLRPLKDAASHQVPFARCLYQIFGPRNASCRAKKSEFRHRVRILDEASCVLYYLGSYSCPVGPWRSWERASMASRRSWVRIPSAPPLLAHVFPRLYPFERDNKPLLRWSDAGRQRAPRLPQRELFQVAPESGAVAAGLSKDTAATEICPLSLPDALPIFLPGGAVAQLGPRLDAIEEVVGSNPIGSTTFGACLSTSIS